MMIAIAILAMILLEPDDLRALRLRHRRQHPGRPTRRRPGQRHPGRDLRAERHGRGDGRDPRRVAGPERPGEQRPVPDVHRADRHHRRRHEHPRRRGDDRPDRRSAACSSRSSPTGSTCSGSTRSTSRSPSVSSCCWPSASTPGRDGSSSRGSSAARACITSATSTGRSPTTRRLPAPLVRAWRGCASSVRSRGRSTRTSPSAAIQPGGWLAPHVHSFEEALYVLEGELLLELAGTVHRLVRRLRPDADRLSPRARQQRRGAGPVAVAHIAAAAAARTPAGKDTFFEPAQDLAAMDAAATRPPFGDPTLRLVGHYDGTGPQLETLRDQGRGARPRARPGATPRCVVYSGISVKMLVDHAVRRRPRDDVHGRLRARRRRPGARPPVRGGVRLPRRRGRGRVRRRSTTPSRPVTSPSPASARSTASTTPAPSGSAGSRPRPRSRRHATPIAGSATGSATRPRRTEERT